jgi:hypothetical protein
MKIHLPIYYNIKYKKDKAVDFNQQKKSHLPHLRHGVDGVFGFNKLKGRHLAMSPF